MTQQNPNVRATGRTTNKLTNQQNFRLYNWLQRQLEAEIFPVGTSKDQVARRAEAELGIPIITGNNIDGALMVIGMHLPQPPRTPEQQLLARIEALEAAVAKLLTAQAA